MGFLDDLFGGSSASSIPIPTMGAAPTNLLSYSPSQIDPTQANFLGGIQALGQYNLAGQYMPQAQDIASRMLSDPNAASYLRGAGGASNLGQMAALNQMGAGGQIYGTSMDPQQALYGRTLDQVTQAARANAEAAGLGTSPVGVGAVDWATNQFNIDWQNQQLNRQIQGAQAASGLQAGAAPLFMQSAAYPWQTGQAIGQAGLGTLANLGQYGITAANIPGQQLAGWQNSIAQQLAAQQQAYAQQQGQFVDASQIAQMNLAQQKQQFDQQQATAGGIGKILGTVGGAALGGMLGGPAGMFAGAGIGGNIFGGGAPTGGGTTGGTGWGNLSNIFPTSWGGSK